MSRAAHAPLRPQVVHQFFFQYATRLNEKALLARPDGVLAVSGDGQKEECRREAATQRECNYAASQKRVQSHAASVPPSSESKRHASHSQKAQNASLIS